MAVSSKAAGPVLFPSVQASTRASGSLAISVGLNFCLTILTVSTMSSLLLMVRILIITYSLMSIVPETTNTRMTITARLAVLILMPTRTSPRLGTSRKRSTWLAGACEASARPVTGLQISSAAATSM